MSQNTSPDIEAPKRPTSAKKGTAPLIRKLKTRYPEMTQREIAKRVGCSPGNVHTVLSKFLGKTSDADLRQFQDSKADIYDALQHRLLSSLTPAKIAKAPAVSLITGAAILEDKARLIRGLATGINVNVLLDVVQAMRHPQPIGGAIAPAIIDGNAGE
jgi:hypothetical protein